jgi:predicted metal-dependent peptidase
MSSISKYESPRVRIKKGRTQLLLNHPFFGTMLYRLKDRECRSIETMATDGKSLFYNPEFVDSLNMGQLLGVLAHEVLHPALQHHTRRGKRDPKQWNVACDYVINPVVMDAGLALPEGALYEYRFRDLCAERVYNMLAQEQDDQQSGQGQQGDGSASSNTGQGQGVPDGSDQQQSSGKSPSAPSTPGGFGQVLDAQIEEGSEGATPNDQLAEQRREWAQAVQDATTVAKMAGKLPGGAERLFEAAESGKVDWREHLRQSFCQTTPRDYSWSRPNRRLLSSGYILPGIVKEGVGEIVIAVDCSGSIAQRELSLFVAEMEEIISEHQPEKVHVLYFDESVQRADTFDQGVQVEVQPKGGGGTNFCCVFEHVEDNAMQPQTVIFFTDMWGRFPSDEPDYPVIWAASSSRTTAPFGEVVSLAAA